MQAFPLEAVMKVMAAKNYKVYQLGTRPFNLNIVGIRANMKIVDTFNDLIYIFWRSTNWSCLTFNITTDPGTFWARNPMNKLGTAILKPDQYVHSHKLGKHKGYEALVQVNPVTVYRDNNKDDIIDYTNVQQTGLFGINIHRAGSNGKTFKVNKWSAGCQVFEYAEEFDVFMSVCKNAAKYQGDSFTYTLLEEKDFR